ncbi:MAG: hypothetical protein M3Y42_15890 [Actinomycetota bacterium]|nr:hypothetical protein [Actinomycetota bacterium]MDQ2958429.1 hypothetical protein [Actinomycetota bacterium]
MPHDELAELVARATAAASTESAERHGREKALAALIPVLTRSAKESGIRAVAAGRWLVELVLEITPRLPIRTAPALREQHPGLSDSEIAEKIIRTATKTTAALGAAAGGLAAVEFLSPPALLAAPIQLAAEMLTVTAVELKMVAELHEILGHPALGSVTERGSLYLMSWVRRRAVAPQLGAAGLGSVLGVAAKRELRSQLLRRLGRSTTSLAPFLAGAVAGAEVNRRATKALGETLLAELRGMSDERWFRKL